LRSVFSATLFKTLDRSFDLARLFVDHFHVDCPLQARWQIALRNRVLKLESER